MEYVREEKYCVFADNNHIAQSLSSLSALNLNSDYTIVALTDWMTADNGQ